MRTALYVDGFNLFHRLLKARPDVKWLDLFSLAKLALRDENDVVLVRYFTSRVSDTEDDPGKSTRQDIYLRALASSGVHIHFGEFRERQKRARLVAPSPDLADPYVRIWSREEKGSDVNLAVHMTNDAWLDAFDCAVVLSNDSDLAEALSVVRTMGKIIGLLSPVENPATHLKRHADFVRALRSNHLYRSQFPPSIITSEGKLLTRPAEWSTISEGEVVLAAIPAAL